MCWGSIRQFGRPTEPTASKVEFQHKEELFVHMGSSHRAQVRSQAGPGAGMALSVAPTHCLTRIHPFRVVLQRLSSASFIAQLCGRQIDKFGHHRASCEACSGEEDSCWKVQQPQCVGRRVGPKSSNPFFIEPSDVLRSASDWFHHAGSVFTMPMRQ